MKNVIAIVTLVSGLFATDAFARPLLKCQSNKNGNGGYKLQVTEKHDKLTMWVKKGSQKVFSGDIIKHGQSGNVAGYIMKNEIGLTRLISVEYLQTKRRNRTPGELIIHAVGDGPDYLIPVVCREYQNN